MNKAQMEDQIFEIMLKAAVEENFQRELQELPKEEELADYELSLPAKQKIEKMIKNAYRRSVLLRIQKMAKRAAVVAAIIIPISMASLLSVEASRNAIFNALLDWKADHVDIHYQDEGGSSNEKSSASGSSVIKPKYLPEGFFEAQTVKIGSKNETEYQNVQGVKIILDQIPLSEEGTIAVDTEHTTRKEIEIQGEKAILFAANTLGEKSYLAWANHSYSFLLSSEIPSEQLVKIAESMEK